MVKFMTFVHFSILFKSKSLNLRFIGWQHVASKMIGSPKQGK